MEVVVHLVGEGIGVHVDQQLPDRRQIVGGVPAKFDHDD
jgi:hypothetical protein